MKPKPASPANAMIPHLAELDILRVLTAFAVVGVHTGTATLLAQPTQWGVDLQNIAITLLHFTRALFMAVTAFALTYVYARRPLHIGVFLRKRGSSVLLPYVAFTLLYQWINFPWLYHTHSQLLFGSLYNLISGNAAPQLYYILLTMQFYLLFPFFLWVIWVTRQHHWWLIAAAAAAQLVTYGVLTYGVANLALGDTVAVRWWFTYGNRVVVTYPLFFVLGGVAAWHYDAVCHWLGTHARLIAWGVGISTLAVITVYVGQLLRRVPADQVMVVTQPSILIYSVTIIAGLLALARRWCLAQTQRDPIHDRMPLWHALSDATFGVYLLHFALLVLVLHSWPGISHFAWAMPLAWAIVAGSAWALTLLLLQIPVACRLVGRSHSGRRKRAAAQRPLLHFGRTPPLPAKRFASNGGES